MKAKGILVAAAAVLLLGGVLLLRSRPAEVSAPPAPPKTLPEAPAPIPSRKMPAPRTPGLIRKSDGSSPRSDMLGIPREAAKIAAGIRERAFQEYPALLEKLKGTLTEDEREALELRKADLPGEVSEWSTELVSRREFGYLELFADLFRQSPWFKGSAAEYLAAEGGETSTAVLLEGLTGKDLYARSSAGVALVPYLLEQKVLPAATRDAYLKVLSDNLSAAASDPALHGANETRSEDLAERLRCCAVQVLTRFNDAGATALLLDLETGKDGVSWGPKLEGDVEALYRHLATHGSANNPPMMAERLAAVVDAHIAAMNNPGAEPAGSPIPAALLLAALGLPQKLEELKGIYQAEFAQTAAQPDPEFRAARALLTLRDVRPVDSLIGQLTEPDERLRNRSVTILSEASGQKIGTDRQLLGSGTPEDLIRWSQVQRQWQEWWTTHRGEFQSRNPYAVR